MAASIQPIQFEYSWSWTSGGPWHGFEAASQTYKAGVPLINSSGKLAIALVGSTTIVGVSVSAATGTTSADVPYIPVFPDMTVFRVSVDGAAVGGNAPGTGKPSDFTLYTNYGLTVDTASGLFYLDSSKSASNPIMRIVAFRDGSVTGGTTVNDYVYAQFVRNTLIWS